MGYALTVIRMSAKNLLCSPVFRWTVVLLCLLSGVLGFSLPRQPAFSAVMGVWAKGEDSLEALFLLQKRQTFPLIVYDDPQHLRKDVLSGALHCGYLLEDDAAVPIVSLSGENAYLRPAMNSLVSSAVFTVLAPQKTSAFLEQQGLDVSAFHYLWERHRETLSPPAIQLLNTPKDLLSPHTTSEIADLGQQTSPRNPDEHFSQTSLDPVSISADALSSAETALSALEDSPSGHLLLTVLFSVLPPMGLAAAVSSGETRKALLLLGYQRGVARTCLWWGLGISIAFFLALGSVLGVLGCTGFLGLGDVVDKAPGALLLSLLTAVVYLLGSFAHRGRSILLCLCPMWVMVSIIGGGAFMSPDSLPYGLSLLRFLSPASLLGL